MTIRRTRVLAWLLPIVACFSLGVVFLAAQPSTKVPRVGFLTSATGRTIVLECRVSDGTQASYERLAGELVRSSVDVVFAESSPAVRAARAATGTIPVVALDLETDPVAVGLAGSLARPGGNVTGIFLDLPELSGKRLLLLREALPRLSWIVIVWDESMAAPLAAMERGRWQS